MKIADLTEAQIQPAREFISDYRVEFIPRGPEVTDKTVVTMTAGTLARMVAGYAELRMKHDPRDGRQASIGPMTLRAKLDAAQRLVAEAQMLLQLYVDDDTCSFDHHGDCQTHNCSNPCRNQLAKAWLEDAR